MFPKIILELQSIAILKPLKISWPNLNHKVFIIIIKIKYWNASGSGSPPSLIPAHCTEVRIASFVSSGFITAIVVNPPERKLAKRTSVHCGRATSPVLEQDRRSWILVFYNVLFNKHFKTEEICEKIASFCICLFQIFQMLCSNRDDYSVPIKNFMLN